MTMLSRFFLNEVPDDKGRFLNEMLQKDFTWMEETHDYVQWWFPNATPSKYSKKAPLLTEQDIYDVYNNTDATIGFMACVNKMLPFFGFKFDEAKNIVKTDEFEERRNVLCGEFNHNHMRFTRFLLAMYYFGFGKSARKIFDVVSQEATEKTSVEFWRASIEDNGRLV